VDGPHSLRKLAVDMVELEAAFENDSWDVSFYLDVETGEVLFVTDETRRELEELYEEGGEAGIARRVAALDVPEWMKEALLEADRVEERYGTGIVEVPRTEPDEAYGVMEDFIATLPDPVLRGRLERAVVGRGAFRRFKDVLASRRDERQRWFDFEREATRSRIVAWLESVGVDPVFEPLPMRPPEPPPRPRLLAEAMEFARKAREIPGTRRIALVGSVATDRGWPKDVDLLVTVADDADLSPLAKLARRLQGHLQSAGLGSDVFLADPTGRYLGRVCPWSRCGPGIRVSCDALHCGRRTFLHDDLETVRLTEALVALPPVELWPEVLVRVEVPDDVRDALRSLG
jgi:predicted nucleotidyltransferase